MIYNVVFASTAIVNIFSYLSFKARARAYYLILAGLFIFVTFRWDVGCDWGSYWNHSVRFSGHDFSEAIALSEPGYWVLVTVLDKLGLSYPWINIPAGLSFFVGIHVLAKRQPDPLIYISLAYPTLMTNLAMSGTRQSLAFGLVCFAFVAFFEKKIFKFVIFLLIGMQFHRSAAAFLAFLPFLLNIGARYKILSVFALLPIAVYFMTSETADVYTSMYLGTGVDAQGALFRVFPVAATGLIYLGFLRPLWHRYFPIEAESLNVFSYLMLAVFGLSIISSVMGDRFNYYIMPLAYIIQSKAYLVVNRRYALPVFLLPLFTGGISLLGWTLTSFMFERCFLPYQTWGMTDVISKF